MKIKCLICNQVIKSNDVHDFKWCACENIFIDGGDEYLRYGGNGVVDGTFEMIEEEVKK